MLDLCKYDPIIVSWSGGDDSTACLTHILSLVAPERIKAVWCDTGAEHPETYEYIWHMAVAPRVIPREVEVIAVRGCTVYGGSLEEGIRRRGMWPGARYRYCTKHLKTVPTAHLIRQREWRNGLLVLGQRREESASRAELDEFEFIGSCGIPVWRPALDWNKADVRCRIAEAGWPRNRVYEYQSRGGNCAVCIMARPLEIIKTARWHPGLIEHWVNVEADIGHRWGDGKGESIANFLATARDQMFLPGMEFKPSDHTIDYVGCDSGFCEMG